MKGLIRKSKEGTSDYHMDRKHEKKKYLRLIVKKIAIRSSATSNTLMLQCISGRCIISEFDSQHCTGYDYIGVSII